MISSVFGEVVDTIGASFSIAGNSLPVGVGVTSGGFGEIDAMIGTSFSIAGNSLPVGVGVTSGGDSSALWARTRIHPADSGDPVALGDRPGSL
jgi:hypothetical protein